MTNMNSDWQLSPPPKKVNTDAVEAFISDAYELIFGD
jgi:hypothetical protein